MRRNGSNAILWLEHVSKQYGRRRVLHDVDLLLPTHSFTLLTGPNGAGKTTLLRILATTARPSSGTVHWGRADGTETRDPQEARTRLTLAAHTPLVYDELTARENLDFALRIRGQDAPRTDAGPWLRRFGLEARAHDRVEDFSRGQRQRLALALAFAPRPEYLLLDEPGNNLDENGRDQLAQALDELRGHATIVMATHDPAQHQRRADQTLEVRAGKVQPTGGPS